MDFDAVVRLKAEIFASLIYAPAGPSRRLSYGGSRSPRPRPPLAIALGIAPAKRENDFRLAVRVQDPALMEAPVLFDIIDRAGGEVDLDYIGELRQLHALPPPLPFGATFRPLIAGSSISHIQGDAGTVGLFPWAADRTRRVLLSNNHVLARNNAAQLGDAIVQPAIADGGSIQYQVGSLERFERIEVPGPNAIDAAIASIDYRFGPPNLLIAGQRAVHGIRSARAGEAAIWKFGKSTGGTKGRVGVSLVDNVRVQVASQGEALFHRVIEIRGTNGAFGSFGDSGAAVMGADDFAIGLLFAGSPTQNVTYAFDLPTVFRKFGLPLDIPYDQP